MILSAQSIRSYNIITPFCERTVFNGLSFGLSGCGYDIRIAQTINLSSKSFNLASTVEHFEMPDFVVGQLWNKSTWARRGLTMPNTILEPGWKGHLTLELFNSGWGNIFLEEGTPIAQITFQLLDKPTDQPYEGKYQDQENHPVAARFEG